MLSFGRLADRYGSKNILSGHDVTSGGILELCLSTSLASLVFSRTIQGIASAMIFSNSTAILMSVVSPQSRGKMLGFNSAATLLTVYQRDKTPAIKFYE